MKKLRIMGTWLLASVLVIALSGVAQAGYASVSELEGNIDSLSENSMVVGDQTILLSGETEIVGTLAVGATVEVEILVLFLRFSSTSFTLKNVVIAQELSLTWHHSFVYT